MRQPSEGSVESTGASKWPPVAAALLAPATGVVPVVVDAVDGMPGRGSWPQDCVKVGEAVFARPTGADPDTPASVVVEAFLTRRAAPAVHRLPTVALWSARHAMRLHDTRTAPRCLAAAEISTLHVPLSSAAEAPAAPPGAVAADEEQHAPTAEHHAFEVDSVTHHTTLPFSVEHGPNSALPQPKLGVVGPHPTDPFCQRRPQGRREAFRPVSHPPGFAGNGIQTDRPCPRPARNGRLERQPGRGCGNLPHGVGRRHGSTGWQRCHAGADDDGTHGTPSCHWPPPRSGRWRGRGVRPPPRCG
jgi:hypothetical protein